MRIKTLVTGGSVVIMLLVAIIWYVFLRHIAFGDLIALGSGALILVVFLFIISSYISKPVNNIKKAIDEITEGNLNVELKKGNIEEYKGLVASLDKIMASLKLAVLRIGVSGRTMSIRDILKSKQDTETQLKKSENFVHNILVHSGIPLVSYDKEGNLLVVNTDFLEMSGYSKEELATKDSFFAKAFPTDMVKNKINDVFSKFRAGKAVEDFVIPIRKKNDSTVITISNITAMHDDGGNLTGEAMFFRDLSEIFGLEEQIRYWAANGFTQEQPTGKRESKIEISQPIK